MLSKLGISKSGYYSWRKREKSAREIRKERVVKDIKEIYQKSYQNYGAPKIAHILREQGEVI